MAVRTENDNLTDQKVIPFLSVREVFSTVNCENRDFSYITYIVNMLTAHVVWPSDTILTASSYQHW